MFAMQSSAGFGVRVLSSGAKRFFIHIQYRGKRIWKIVAKADAMHVDEARARAASMLRAIRGEADVAPSTEETLFETVAEAVFRRYSHVWNRIAIKHRIDRPANRLRSLHRLRAAPYARTTPC